MVRKSIINVRRSSICWRGQRELITDVRKPGESWLWRHCKWRLFTDSRSPSNCLSTKLKSTGAGRYQLLSRWWDAYHKQLGLKDFSPKSQDAVALQQIKERGALLELIVVISVRQSTVAAISGLHCRALVMVSFEHEADSLIAKFKEAGGTVREIDVWAESPRLSPLWLSPSSSHLSWAVNHYRDNAITYKAQKRDKNARELKLANAAITDMQMRQRDVAALDAKYTKG